MAQQRRVTMQDVARLAGLSTASVSRALTGARPVNADVAARVALAVHQLGYRPDGVARSLRRQETRTLGLIVSDITNPFFPVVVQAVEQEARRSGFGLLLIDVQNDVDIEKESVNLLLDKRIDALLISPSHRFLSKALIDSASEAVPVVQLDRVADESKGFVRVDQAHAVNALIDHMVDEGHTHLAFIGSDPSVSTSWERQEAFVDRAPRRDAGAASRVLVGDFSVEWGREAASSIPRLWPDVNGVICANDLIAFGALQQFTQEGMGVPGRIAVSGFDDTLLAQASNLTSIRQPVGEMAAIAVQNAVHPSATSDPAQSTLVPELVVRASSGHASPRPPGRHD